MTTRRFVDWDFEHIGQIVPDRDHAGSVVAHMPQARYKDAGSKPLHAYGAGPFCRFRIARDRQGPGLFVLTLDGHPVYIGASTDLARSWGPNGFGGISPRNCFRGGQETNCRINAAILKEAIDDRTLDLWFLPYEGTEDQRREIRTVLIQSLAPSWNRAA